MSLTLRKLSYALGAEICEFDVARPIDEQSFGDIYRTFLDYGVLLFRNQNITPEQHIAFSRHFGELDGHDALPRDRHPNHPEILILTNTPKSNGESSDTKYAGRRWHSDLSFTLTPSLGSLLRGVSVPDVGGDTMFANMYRAYECLSDGMKKLISGLYGIHASGTRKMDSPSKERLDEQRMINPPVAQPLVRIHPETSKKALYISEKVKSLEGMTEEESQPLISYLCKHATRPEFVYRHRWRRNDILVWDNRCTMHLALGDFDQSQRRYMERTTILGAASGHLVVQ
ncbi:MAG: TauD/TfdA dioxygenase family protein [Ktedonobacteraceae bacterium]